VQHHSISLVPAPGAANSAAQYNRLYIGRATAGDSMEPSFERSPCITVLP
jgi:hypothetical protein